MTAEPCSAVEPLQSAWLDDRLDEAERDRVARHLQSCAPCRAAVDGLDRTRTLLGAAPVRAMPASLLAAIKAAEVPPVPGTGDEPVRDPRADRPARAGAPGAVSDDDAGRPPGRVLLPAGASSRSPGSPGRVATLAVAVVGVLGATAFALGGEPPAEERRVEVPVDLFVADHMVRTVSGPVSTPVLVER